ncbi:MAG: hypothetical protein ChlgKO_13250 [Chlamydiales bacterium]
MAVRKMGINRFPVSPEFNLEDAKMARRGLLPYNASSSEIDQIYCDVETKKREHIKDPKYRIIESYDQIHLHVEKRISLFFLQVIACYNTGKTFHEAPTIHQGYNAKKIGPTKFQAAHSATNPNLSTDEKIYLYRSHLYDESNATLDLPKEVNDADRAIDEKYRDSFLRRDSIDLLNRASQGLISPVDATKEFVALFLRESAKFTRSEKNGNVVEVLKVYKQAGESLSALINKPNSPQFEKWLNINLENPLAPYFIDRYQREDEFDRKSCLSLIKGKINYLRAELLEERSQKHTARAPTHFTDLFYLEIFKRLNQPGQEIIGEAIEKNYEHLCRQTHSNTGPTKDILAANNEKIARVIDEVTPLACKAWGSEVETDDLLPAFPKKRIALSIPLFRHRFEVIQADLQTQSVIKSKFDEAFQKIQRENKRLPHLYSFFYYNFLCYAPPILRTQLSKLLNIPYLTLKQTVRELRYNQRVHSALAAKATPIQKLAIEIRSAAKENINGAILQRKLTSLFKDINHPDAETLFYARLYEEMQTNEECNFLSGLINKSFEEVTAWITSNCMNASKAEIALNHVELNQLVNFAAAEIKNSQKAVQTYQSKVFEVLRVGHGYKIKDFVLEYLKNHPRPMSVGTASNLETGKRAFEPELIKHLAEFFDVMESIFYPSTFSQ